MSAQPEVDVCCLCGNVIDTSKQWCRLEGDRQKPAHWSCYEQTPAYQAKRAQTEAGA